MLGCDAEIPGSEKQDMGTRVGNYELIDEIGRGGMGLADPFQRVIVYSIFGFIGCLMTVASFLALVAERAREASEYTSSLPHAPAGSTARSDALAQTETLASPQSRAKNESRSM
jgi:hypothetical protein